MKKSYLKEMLIGKILGDGHLETQNNGATWRLKIEHSFNQKEYVDHQYSLLSHWVSSAPRIIKKENSFNYFFQTKSIGDLRFLGLQFYNNKKKIVPKILSKLMTPISLAYWYSDDGSIKSKQSKGVIFNTQNFTFDEVKFLCSILKNKFDLICWPRKQQQKYQIYVSGKSYSIIRELIYKYLIPEMRYKFPEQRMKELTKLPKK
jgi:hypothetical protein